MKILFTGGGSGGHLFPIIAIVRELKKQNRSWQMFYVGPKNETGTDLLLKEGVVVKPILAGKIRRYITPKGLIQNMADIFFRIPIGFFEAFLVVKAIGPNIVFSKGGYGSLAVVFWAWIFKIPVFLHESDAVPGMSSRISSKWAEKIFTSFENTLFKDVGQEKIVCVGNPIRIEILQGDSQIAKELFNLSDKKPVLLILGGSQGAERINMLILAVLPRLLQNFEVIHQCGAKNIKETLALATVIVKDKELMKNYHLQGFLTEKELAHACKVCHVIFSRAGSGAIFEIAASGKPSILLPLPEAAQDHQAKNALIYSQSRATIVMEPQNPTPNMFYSKLMSLFSQPETIKEMSQRALRFAKPQAAKIIAQELINWVSQ